MKIKKQIHLNSQSVGRMGNQLFQYACAKALQWEYGYITSLNDLDKIPYFELEEGEYYKNRLKSFLFFRFWRPLFGMDILNTKLDCLHRDYLHDLISIQKPTLVSGFFQSPNYFASIKPRIKKYFTIKDTYYKGFNQFLTNNKLKKDSYLAVHLRRTDYKGFTVPGLQGDDFTLPVSYYQQALQEVQWNGPVVFVSDEPDAVNGLFPDLKNIIISHNDEITDFLILQHAGSAIISNSTFAWWAVWLNDEMKTVICPKYFLGFKEQKEVPVNIYPKEWKQVDVYEN